MIERAEFPRVAGAMADPGRLAMLMALREADVLTAADLAEAGEAEGPALSADTPVREVMERLCHVPAVALSNGQRITREGVIARLIDPRGGAAG